MKSLQDTLMAQSGVIVEEKVRTIGKHKRGSRGFYITGFTHLFYLHKDGVARESVNQPDGGQAFWDTEKDAQEFLDNYKARILAS